MTNSKCIIAAAGSGKTTHIINESLKIDKNKKILITTFTQENEKEIKRKFIEKNQSIPSNIIIKTWWALLLQHGVRPYYNFITPKGIKGLDLKSGKSGVKYYMSNGIPVCYRADDVENYYFSPKTRKIYSDKIAHFVITADKKSKGAVFDRFSKIFDYVFIDEVQDLAGYDLEIVKKVIKKTPTTMVGDPRQVVFRTHATTKYKKYQNGLIDNFIRDHCSKHCEIDDTTLQGSYRCNKEICAYSNTLFKDLPAVESLNRSTTDHDGIFFINSKDVVHYLKKYTPTQLRYSCTKKVVPNHPVLNFGMSKGRTFDRVLIYPTEPIKKHISNKKGLKPDPLCKYYVAITRARHSVAIIYDNPPSVEGISKYDPSN